MVSQILVAPGVARTERGLVVAGSRLTLYAIMDFINYNHGIATSQMIQERFLIDAEQVAAVLEYMDAHRDEFNEEYQDVLRQAEELEQFYAERNREVLARIAALPPKPEHAAVRARLAQARARRQGA